MRLTAAFDSTLKERPMLYCKALAEGRASYMVEAVANVPRVYATLRGPCDYITNAMCRVLHYLVDSLNNNCVYYVYPLFSRSVPTLWR